MIPARTKHANEEVNHYVVRSGKEDKREEMGKGKRETAREEKNEKKRGGKGK
jgi:uncharacterized sporulation protein YeaH/YhbH (DUF444 family)